MLDISKRHKLWFSFARKPLRFSMQEFYAVTGLRCEADKYTDFEAWRNDKGFWGTLLKQNGEVDMKTIRLKHLTECKDWSRVDRYPWGLHAYDLLIDSIKKARFKLKKNSYILDGFAYALQIWLMEAIPDIGTLLGQKYKEGITSVRKKEDHLFK
ncbi:hypothetical protein F2Q69_00037061 [Brassica cretica]|uniref:DUF1985 domain-containing protein n=1 Tax=Brassica cretica TaxID=69181 RepID=A0A8S9SPK9_BRACR|nr:hypothetical protein F2Q69_00037061 [Brassica cretica]